MAILFSVIATEWMKLRRSYLLWLLPAGAVLTAILVWFGAATQKASHAHPVTWNWLVFNMFEYTALFAAPILFSLTIGYLIASEFQYRTVNSLFTYSISRLTFLVCKHLIMIPVIVGILGCQLLLTLLVGLLIGLEPLSGEAVWNYVSAMLAMSSMTCCFLPLAALVSTLTRSYMPNVVLGIVVLVASVGLMTIPDKAVYFPWCVPLIVLKKFVNGEVPNAFAHASDDIATGIVVLLVTFAVPFAVNLLYFRTFDVDQA